MTRKKKTEVLAGRVYRRRRRDPNDKTKWIESKGWWIQYYHHRQIRKPAKTKDYGKAVEFLNRQLELAAAGKILPLEVERMKFADLMGFIARDYRRNERRSIGRVEGAMAHLKAFFGSSRPADIDLAAIDGYVDYRKEVDKAANATIKYELSILKRSFSLTQGILKIPQFPVIRTANVRKGFFGEEDFKAFIVHFEEELQPVLRFAYLTGWRMKSEIFPLQWQQVDFQAGEVRLEPGTTKTEEGRTFPFAVLPELELLLRQQKEYTDRIRRERNLIVPWVFHRAGRKIESIRGAWAAAVKNSKIGHRIPHDFRRTAVRHLEWAGVPRSVAMKMVGHKTESIYLRYAIVGKNDLVDGARRLASYREHLQGVEQKVIPIKPKEEMK